MNRVHVVNVVVVCIVLVVNIRALSVAVATTSGAAAATAARGLGTGSVEGTKTGGFGAPPSERSVSTGREHRSCVTYRGLFEGIFAP